jgi:hypothetical protein
MNMMSAKNETTDQAIVIEDLSAENAKEVKGGSERPKEYLTIVVKDQFICS